jgi:RNA polymerase sigma-70 factor (ECF subfamily)
LSPAETLEKEMAARDPDVRLMLQVRDDVDGAFAQLVERYQNRLLGLLSNMTSSTQDAEDLVQEVFLRIYRSRKGYRPKSKFSTWLFTVASNLALNRRRDQARRPVSSLASGGGSQDRPGITESQVIGSEPTASGPMRQAELAQVVQEAVASLDDDQRLAVLLCKFEQMSYAEVAEAMNRSEAAIKSLLSRARMNLRERLEPYQRNGQKPR